MPGPAPIFVNARFLGEPITGLQRWGREVLRALDAMVEDGTIDRKLWKFVLLLPGQPAADAPTFRHHELRPGGILRSHLWEQFELPWRARGGPLLNFKNTAPITRKRQLVVIHDLQVFARPDTHSAGFNRVYRFLLPRGARRAQALCAVSRSTAAEIEKYFNIPRARISVTGGGHEHVLAARADLTFLDRHQLPRGRYLLAVSSLNPNKNFAAILRALKLAALDVPLVIAGETNARVFAGAGAQLPAGAIQVGRVNDGELRALYENALGFVFPSFYEGWGLPPGEAMALGCPVLVSITTSLPEVCGEAAFYCDPTDDASIARALTKMVQDEPERRRMAALGPAQAGKHTWRGAAEKVWAASQPLLRAGD
jgi:glycosyltransferase involved in cell wall biosynthesis